MREHLESRLRELDLANVRILTLLPRDAFMRLLSAADICLVTQQRTVADVVFPSKVVTLLAAGKPVVASVNAASAIARTIAEAGAGVVITPEDPAALSGAIDSLLRNPEERRRMAAHARRYARHKWDRTRILQEFEATLRQAPTGTLPEIPVPAPGLSQIR
jgi:colanic acid biosynthesis glycosyl transferase WcaI